jgi:hypothetical protein
VRHIIPISGKDSLATALVQTMRYPDLPYEFIFNDVRGELPETYEWLDGVEQKTGWKIERVGKSLIDIIEGYGGFLPGPNSRYCTRQSKIEPMEAFIGKGDTTIYYGLRADEPSRTGYTPLKASRLMPAYPLRDLDIDIRGVYAILDAQGMSPPNFFWQRLFDAVCLEMEGFPLNWRELLTRSEKSALFAGRSRGNCFFCFFQRQYEWLWLKETHLDLFQRAAGMEKQDYSFSEGFPLSRYDDESTCSRIFAARVKAVRGMIQRRFQLQLFEGFEESEIALTSCGLLCGK